jgi:hypothetical protein
MVTSSLDLLNNLIFFIPAVLAVSPLFMPSWRWYLWSVGLFLVSDFVFLYAVASDLNGPGSDAPAGFGAAIYMWLLGAAFLCSSALRLLVFLTVRAFLGWHSRRHTKPNGFVKRQLKRAT